MINVLVLNYNDADSVMKLVNCIETYKCIDHIVIVDNCSQDDSFQRLKSIVDNKVDLVSSGHNGGYGAGNNFGIRYIADHYQSNYILLCNPDVIIKEDVIIKLAGFLQTHDDYVMAAPFMLDAEKQKQYNTAFRIPEKWEYIFSLDVFISKLTKSFHYKGIDSIRSEYKDVEAVSGSLFLLDTNKMLTYGMYDENIFLYCEEIVLAIKLKKAQLKTALLLTETFIHNHSVSIDKSFHSQYAKHTLLMKSKLYVIKNYYNSNRIENLLAYLLSRISLLEVMVISKIRGK
ncbi:MULTISPECIES: glycosyltransferase family 2 protein [Megasphaera]|uniref:Glycosyltransferase, group 2 family protein n=1 Tax=Megasphaera vaginalis (ex Srinivasan et al. 2021) TaxID=1111454 RepID=U7USL7_9FIRM|nr:MULTISPECIES: glycosyltransferase family 2 protein [Megasphaera]ERT62271.1 glycosyltransferase, group 2 family protein [Megasphaera vaginalis (ex Srinivasan et al. 2021)]